MKIQVTQDNIDHGLRGSCTSDPVALALKDLDFIHPYVSPSQIRVNGRRGVYFDKRVPTPSEVLEFLERFDNSDPAAVPFTFELEL